MEKALATFRNGQVEFDHPVRWPEGTRLEVSPKVQKIGLDESEWPETPEEKAEWLRWLNNLEPFDMTPQELETFETELKGSKRMKTQADFPF